MLFFLFFFLTVVISIFVSNTATANLLVPLVMSMPEENRLLLTVVVTLACSFDMVLPISTPSNALAFSTHVISVQDMMKSGFVIIAIAITALLLGSSFFIVPILSRS